MKSIKVLLSVLTLLFSSTAFGQKQMTVSPTSPSTCNGNNGQFAFSGLDVSTTYSVSYQKSGSKNDTFETVSNSSGIVAISNLEAGLYSNFIATSKAGVAGTYIYKGEIELNDNCHRRTVVKRPTCDGNNGTIIMKNMAGGTPYYVSYLHNGVLVRLPNLIIAEHNNDLIIPHLSSGTYTSVTATPAAAAGTPIVAYPVELTDDGDRCIARQSTKFSAAAFASFTGVQDDYPTGFTQFYARLSQPFNKAQGIDKDATVGERFIFMRNFLFQMNYGNTDNFKMYSANLFGERYVNRLDLLAHSYFNGSLSLNLLTFVMPKNWNSHNGHMGAIHLDYIMSLAATNVTDTNSVFNGIKETRTYNIKTPVYGGSIKTRFNDVFNSNFTIELGGRMFWILPSSRIVNSSLNPQNPDLRGYDNSVYDYSSQSDSVTLHSFVSRSKNVMPYYTLEALVKYKTGKDENSSNIFLRYQFTSNYVRWTSGNFNNNFFQFQLGYDLDITKIFPKKAAEETSTQ